MTYLRLRSDILGNEDGAPARAVLCIMAFLLCFNVPGSFPWFIGGMVLVILLDMAMTWLDDRWQHREWIRITNVWMQLRPQEIMESFLDDWFIWAKHRTLPGKYGEGEVQFRDEDALCTAFWHWQGYIAERYGITQNSVTWATWRARCNEAGIIMRKQVMEYAHGRLKERISSKDPFCDKFWLEDETEPGCLPRYHNPIRVAFAQSTRRFHFCHLLAD